MALKPAGVISVWRYTDESKYYVGWHLALDRLGCESMLEKLHSMEISLSARTGIFEVATPTSIVRSTPGAHLASIGWESRKQLVLEFVKDDPVGETWSIESEASRLVIRFGARKLQELRAGVTKVSNYEQDFNIKPTLRRGLSRKADRKWYRSNTLWFWCCAIFKKGK